MFENLNRAEGGIRVVLKIADLLLQIFAEIFLIAKIAQYGIIVDDILRRTVIAIGAFPDDPKFFSLFSLVCFGILGSVD
ncbi:hypothetical protein ACLBWS_09520 [Brucellaceae bacterium D45D]